MKALDKKETVKPGFANGISLQLHELQQRHGMLDVEITDIQKYEIIEEAAEKVGEVLDALRLLKNEGMTMMIVTQEVRFAKEVSDRVSFLNEGQVIESDSPNEIIDNPKETETIKFLERSLKW